MVWVYRWIDWGMDEWIDTGDMLRCDRCRSIHVIRSMYTCIHASIVSHVSICIDHIAYMHASIASHASHHAYRSHRLYRSHHMHRSQRIHACIDRVICIDHITWHRSHDMLDFVTVWHPPGIENSRYSLFRTPPCFDTGRHRCHGLHIRCQSDVHRHRRTCCISMSNSSSSLSVPTLFDTGVSPTSFGNRHVAAWIELQLR